MSETLNDDDDDRGETVEFLDEKTSEVRDTEDGGAIIRFENEEEATVALRG